jgi:hypothetical protein
MIHGNADCLGCFFRVTGQYLIPARKYGSTLVFWLLGVPYRIGNGGDIAVAAGCVYLGDAPILKKKGARGQSRLDFGYANQE